MVTPDDYKNNQYFKTPSRSVAMSWGIVSTPIEYFYYIYELMKFDEPI